MNKSILNKFNPYVFVILIFIACVFLDVVIGVERGSEYRLNRLLIQLLYVLSLCIMFIVVIKNNLLGIRGNIVGHYYLFFLIVIIYGIVAFISNPKYSLYEFGNLLKFVMWIICIPFFYIGFRKGMISLKILKVYILSNVLFSVLLVLQSLRMYEVTSVIMGANQAYNLLFLMPLVLLNFKPNVKYSLIFIIAIAILISMKRGPIIIFVLISMLSFKSFGKETSFAFKLIVGSVFAIGIYYFFNLYKDALEIRFSELIYGSKYQDTYGSGRSEFYTLVFWGWLEGTVLNFVFGNGFFSVPDYLKIVFKKRIVAHNDWLEMAYSFGLLGIILYIRIFYQMVANYYKYVKKNIKNVYLVFLIIFLGTSVFSHTFYNSYSIFISITIAYFCSILYKEDVKCT